MSTRQTPRYLLLTLGYAALLQASYAAALLMHFDGAVPPHYWTSYFAIAPFFTALSLGGFFFAGLYHGLWRYASTVTLFQIFKGVTLSALSMVVILLFAGQPLFPRSLIVQVWMWELILLGGLRFAWRLSRERVLGPLPLRAGRALVVGTGHAGVHLIQEMRRGPSGHELLTPIGFIDEDARVTGQQVEGVKVLGTIADLPRVLQEQRAEIVIVSEPDLPAPLVREIARFCDQASVRIKTLPGLSDLQHGKTALSQMRDMRIEDLLGRQPVQLNLDEVAGFLRHQRVLVTGAGGSIGSELARQVAGFAPENLVLLDHAENGLYFVHHELVAEHPGLTLHPVVGDIRDADAIESVFQRFRPTVVFHAAAHKHVPLLEANPREAVLNNIVGTANLTQAADRHAVGKFVLISTDKAVNPTSVMGASKRVCEMVVQSRSQHSATRFVAVRFGNVLGSDGSVIPLFQRQLQRGGPITVTHPEARRYFMTIPEAVRLVLQAGAMGRGGEVFLLDMGEQVRIVDLARQLIRMAGMREGEDIEIVFTGLRPGEKLYEELHSDSESTRITRHERILVWELDPRDEQALLEQLRDLEAVAHTGDATEIKRRLHALVPEYQEPRFDPDPVASAPPTPIVELPAAAADRQVALRRTWGGSARQLLDAGVAAVLLGLSAPLWALIWLEAWRAGQAEPFHRDVYVGRTRRGPQRRVRKNRMPIERRSIERRTQDLSGEPFRGARFRSDLGPVSRWVARRRLDLVPLLLNVMRGEMALVGPRPAKQELVLRWSHQIPDYERRFTVLPGVTGLAQIAASRGGDAVSMTRRVQYDLYYVDHRSLVLDIRTLFRTLGVVLSAPRPAQRLSTHEMEPTTASVESAGTSAASEDGAAGVVPAGGVAAGPPAVK